MQATTRQRVAGKSFIVGCAKHTGLAEIKFNQRYFLGELFYVRFGENATVKWEWFSLNDVSEQGFAFATEKQWCRRANIRLRHVFEFYNAILVINGIHIRLAT